MRSLLLVLAMLILALATGVSFLATAPPRPGAEALRTEPLSH
jgi:hypothetical protein